MTIAQKITPYLKKILTLAEAAENEEIAREARLALKLIGADGSDP